jgi:hypothetical protein
MNLSVRRPFSNFYSVPSAAVIFVLAAACLFRPFSCAGQTMPADSARPLILSAAPEGGPIQPFESEGDLWMNTWADDGNLYSGWGDGRGVVVSRPGWTDCGLARFSGDLPGIQAEEICFLTPTEYPRVNDKPSSFLFLDGQMVGAFHSPMGDPWMGYLAVSKDRGATWTRLGFFEEGQWMPQNASPWTRDNRSKFRCLFFINMGRAYSLNGDGYVYALGIGTEYGWMGGTYLCRVPKESILDYSAYRYFTHILEGQPAWSPSQDDARPLDSLFTRDQGSSMYHPFLKRYLFMTTWLLYESPEPWGPWTKVGAWRTAEAPVQWLGAYQPGVIPKDMGPDWFWFTASGQQEAPKMTYTLHLGRMRLKLAVASGIAKERNGLPESLRLRPVYPNPFNASAAVPFQTAEDGHFTLEAFDMNGKSAGTIRSGRVQAGEHLWRWTPSTLPSGVYVVQAVFRTDAGRMLREDRKVLLLK